MKRAGLQENIRVYSNIRRDRIKSYKTNVGR